MLSAGTEPQPETEGGEQPGTVQEHVRDGQEQSAALVYNVPELIRSPAQNGSVETLDPMVVFNEEQRRKIIEAAGQGKSLRAIPEYAGIGKGKPRYQAMKLWLRMHEEGQKA